MTTSDYHVPIMLEEVLQQLLPERGGVFVDGTLGGGGHSAAILERMPSDSLLIGIDRDADAIGEASRRLAKYPNFRAVRGNFFDMQQLLMNDGISQISGVLLDLGVSSHQFDEPERGFSYRTDAMLDMRMDRSSALSAIDVVNGYSFSRLANVIREYGEERFASRIAAAIVDKRAKHSISTTSQLAEIIKQAIPAAARRDGPHPAKRTFQAIRIEVNSELDGLEAALQGAVDLLEPGGRIAVITFHSLEDRIVKSLFKRLQSPCTCPRSAPICVCHKQPQIRILTAKPLCASASELETNPRSSSAKLRAAEKLITKTEDE